MREWFTAAELAAKALPGLPGTDRAIQLRANRENWQRRPRAARGGGYEYPITALPEEARITVMREQLLAAGAAGAAIARRDRLQDDLRRRTAEAGRQAGLAQFMKLDERRQREADAKALIVRACDDYIARLRLPKKRGRELFAHEYAEGRIPVEDWVRALVPSFCSGSIENWRGKLQNEGLASLAGKYGQHRKGTGIIDTNEDMKKLVLGMLVDHPHVSAKLVMRAIRARFKGGELPSYRTLQRFMANWKVENEQLLAAVTNPDAWRSRYQAAGGDADAKIIRLNQRWEFDSTKADLMLADNYRHVIVGSIDVYSRRLKYQVSRSSSSAAVAALTRKCLLDWGVPEEIGTDNGSDYVSQRIKRIIAALDIHQDVAPPFTPEHKPFIERSFQTMLHDLVELLPGYIGHNVAERKDIEARRSFAQRMMKEGERIEIRMTPEELQEFLDQWVEQFYGIEAHSGLGGRSPFEVANAWTGQITLITDERALDVLLAEAPDNNGFRTVTKKGIRLDKANFEHPALGGLEGTQVKVLLDDADIGHIYVFDEDGAFICKAICPERTGISRQELAAARKATQKKRINEEKARLKAIAREVGTKDIVHEILLDRARDAGKLAVLPKRNTTEHSTEALRQAGKAARAGKAPAAKPMTAAEQARLQALEAELSPELPTRAKAEVVQLPVRETRETRFTRALDIEQRQKAGQPVSEEETRWIGVYRAQPEYRAMAKLYEDFGDAVLTA